MRRHERSLIRVLTQESGSGSSKIPGRCGGFGVEVGVWQGHLSAQLLKAFPDLILIMVDLWAVPEGTTSMHDKDNNAAAMDQAKQMAMQITAFAGGRRSIKQGSSVKWAGKYYGGVFDFVFIDADHYYESVKADVEAWWPKIRSGGILAGHDYAGVGDRREGWGVKRAVDEFFGALGLKVNVEPGLVWWAKKEGENRNDRLGARHLPKLEAGQVR